VSREDRTPFVALLEVMVRETRYGEFDYRSTGVGFPLEGYPTASDIKLTRFSKMAPIRRTVIGCASPAGAAGGVGVEGGHRRVGAPWNPTSSE
jgi:hypothetical protein